MTGVEIDMVVTDSLKALELYEKIFEVKRIEVTDYPKGTNEAVFTIYDTRFHMLDENPEYQLIAPKPGQPQSVWYNVLVPDIQAVYDKAIAAGCAEIQPVIEMPEMGAANAMFADAFGYVWMLHQIYREVSFEERCKAMEEKQK
ncbi:VOC family protein [Eubacterium callanderi]|uniref:VOC family protein n=1 Tax=Eubacterium callanderi TaxID=53442 RepID=A0A853JSQ6_9FIRM|nr:VOC family protein [Eubacterium callanderi]